MSTRFNVVLSDELNEQIDKIVEKDETTSKSDVLRRALQLYVASRRGVEEGLAIGLVDPKTREIKTEFVGL